MKWIANVQWLWLGSLSEQQSGILMSHVPGPAIPSCLWPLLQTGSVLSDHVVSRARENPQQLTSPNHPMREMRRRHVVSFQRCPNWEWGPMNLAHGQSAGAHSLLAHREPSAGRRASCSLQEAPGVYFPQSLTSANKLLAVFTFPLRGISAYWHWQLSVIQPI